MRSFRKHSVATSMAQMYWRSWPSSPGSLRLFSLNQSALCWRVRFHHPVGRTVRRYDSMSPILSSTATSLKSSWRLLASASWALLRKSSSPSLQRVTASAHTWSTVSSLISNTSSRGSVT